MIRDFICEGCPKKCLVSIDSVNGLNNVSGNECIKGYDIANKKIGEKKEVLTTLVRIKGGYKNVVGVKSTGPIDLKIHIECSKALSRLNVGAPISIGDIVCTNILNTGLDIVCVENVDKIS